jgi:hypothetical protein
VRTLSEKVLANKIALFSSGLSEIMLYTMISPLTHPFLINNNVVLLIVVIG